MAVHTAANSDTFKVTASGDHEIHLTRVFDAPRHLVFEAMTRPEHIRRWWGRLGDGYSVPVCEVDLRPGGAWRFMAATTLPPTTKALMSAPRASFTYSCTRMLASS